MVGCVVLVCGVVTVLDLYRPFQRTQQLRRMLITVGVGSLVLSLLQYSLHIQQQHQYQQHQQHWQQTFNRALQARAQIRAHTQLTHPRRLAPTLLQRLNAVIRQLPTTLWLTQLQLQPTMLRLQGGYVSAAQVAEFNRRLSAETPANTHHQFTLLPPDQFRIELRHLNNPVPLTRAPSNNPRVSSRVYAWLRDELQQQHLQLITARTTGKHAVALRFHASWLTIQHVLGMLEQLLGAQACSTLTLQSTAEKSVLRASVLCD